MNVKQVINELQKLNEAGYGDYPVCFLYGEWDKTLDMDVPVRDEVQHIEVANKYDGEEIHIW